MEVFYSTVDGTITRIVKNSNVVTGPVGDEALLVGDYVYSDVNKNKIDLATLTPVPRDYFKLYINGTQVQNKEQIVVAKNSTMTVRYEWMDGKDDSINGSRVDQLELEVRKIDSTDEYLFCTIISSEFFTLVAGVKEIQVPAGADQAAYWVNVGHIRFLLMVV